MAITITIAAEDGGASTTCHALVGYIYSRQDVPDIYHRLGAVGSGVQILGRRAKPSRCTAFVLCADVASAETTAGILNTLRGKFVTVLDGFGTSNRCLCHDANARSFAGRHGYGGTMYPFRVEADLVLEYVGLPGA